MSLPGPGRPNCAKKPRDPSRLPSHTRECVEVVQGSHGDIDVGTKAFAGADSVFWLVLPDLLEQAEGVFQVEAVLERFASLGPGPAQVPRSGP